MQNSQVILNENASRCSVIPVSSLSFTNGKPWGCDGDVLLIGCGETLSAVRAADGAKLTCQNVLNGAVVHGVKALDDRLVVFGDKRAKVCRVCRMDGLMNPYLDLEFDFGLLDDLVWDVCWIAPDLLGFGSAQGFVEVWQQNESSVRQWKRNHKVLSKARCILYSLSFSPICSEDMLVVAGGTVFGDIILWNAAPGSEGNVDHRLSGHQGPVFGVTWSDDTLSLCTVGDDRTVRLWRRGSSDSFDFNQLWSSFGHSARVWDCQFIGSEVASVGEDKELRIWSSESGQVLAISEAHFGRNVWKCAVSSDRTTIATGGGDSAVKLWDLFREVQSRLIMKGILQNRIDHKNGLEANKGQNPDVESAAKRRKTTRSMNFISHIRQLHSNRDENERNSQVLLLSADFQMFIVISSLNEPENNPEWIELDSSSYRQVICPETADQQLKSNPVKPGSLACVTMTSTGTNIAVVGTDDGRVLFFSLSVEHSTRTGSACLIHQERVHANMQVTFSHAECRSIFGKERLVVSVSAAEAAVMAWCFDVTLSSLHSVCCAKISPELVQSHRTTAACSFLDKFIITGDHRGNVHFSSPFEEIKSREEQGGLVAEVICDTLPSLHGDSVVGVLAEHNGRVFSGGHNGVVMELQPELMSCSSSLSLKRLQVTNLYRIGTIVSVIQFIRWTVDGNLLVGGNNYNDFVVWDCADQYLLMREKRGGWKRNGELIMDVADPTRYCCLFNTLSTAENKSLGEESVGVRRLGRVTRSSFSIPRKTIGENFHGRSIWTARFLPKPFENYILSGCEDGALKLSFLKGEKKESISNRSLENSWTQFKHYETTLPDESLSLLVKHSTIRPESVRCCCFSTLPPTESKKDRVILVTGGSQETLRCWMIENADCVQPTVSSSPEMIFLCEDASVLQDGTDDRQRILGVYAYCTDPCVGSFGKHRIITGNSMGEIVVFDLQSGSGLCRRESKQDPSYRTIGELASKFTLDHGPSSKPIRSLDCHVLENGSAIAFAGRTNGVLEGWVLEETSGSIIFSTQLHQNGVNTLSVSPRSSSSKELVIVTGGDDQALGVAIFSLENMSLTRRPILVENACASALRGVRTNGCLVWASGLDQRLRVWDILSTGNCSGDNLTPERVWLPRNHSTVQSAEDDGIRIGLVHEEVLDISEIHALDARDDGAVVIAGLGLKVSFV